MISKLVRASAPQTLFLALIRNRNLLVEKMGLLASAFLYASVAFDAARGGRKNSLHACRFLFNHLFRYILSPPFLSSLARTHLLVTPFSTRHAAVSSCWSIPTVRARVLKHIAVAIVIFILKCINLLPAHLVLAFGALGLLKATYLGHRERCKRQQLTSSTVGLGSAIVCTKFISHILVSDFVSFQSSPGLTEPP